MTRTTHLLTASALCALTTAASANPKLLRHPGALPDDYIVVLEGQPAASAADRANVGAAIDRLASAHGATVGHRYSAALRGFSARMTEAQAEALANDPAVAYVEQDVIVRANTVQMGPAWGLDRIDQPALPLDHRFLQLGDGAGVTVYVIDTGLRMTHQEFADRVVNWASVFEDAVDCNGHGTHVAGTIAGKTWGVAKAANIVPVRVLDCNGEGPASDVILGIDWVAQNHVPLAVANISLGGAALAAEDQAVRNLIASGVTTIVAAGNSNADACTVTPARVPEAITVGATTNADVRASFSNWGSCVDISAPGVTIASAGIATDSAINVLDGTSMAAPHVAGVAAAFLAANPTATPALVTNAIIEGATRDRITDTRGTPNRLLSARIVDRTPPELAVLSPGPGDEVTASFRVVVETADPNLAAVALAVDDNVIGTLDTGPFVFDVSALALGEHTLKVTSADAAGQIVDTSFTVTVTGEDPAPEEISGGCSAGGSAGLPLALLVLGAFALRRRATLGPDNCCGF